MKISKEVLEEVKRLGKAMLSEDGSELLDPDPMFVQVDSVPLSIHDRVKQLVERELSMQARIQGEETFEEAMDLDIPEDEEWSPYEERQMTDEYPAHTPPTTNGQQRPPEGDQPVPTGTVPPGETPTNTNPPAKPDLGSVAPSEGPEAAQPEIKFQGMTWVPKND